MKLSIETKVAAAVAAGMMAISAGTIAQTQSSGQAPNQYAPSTSPSVNTHLGNRGYNNMPNTGQNQQSFPDEAAPLNRQNKTTKHKTGKSSKHRTQHNQQDQDTQANGPGY
ncbi:MAG: hypothetical protein ACM3NN_15170 [Nitrospirota bacterium]